MADDFEAILADPRVQMGFLIADTSRLLKSTFDTAMLAEGATRTKWRALIYILRDPGLSQSRLAEYLDIGRAAAGEISAYLVKEGLVERRKNAEDSRAWNLFATDLGYAIAPELTEVAFKLIDEVFANISTEEVSRVVTVLSKLSNALEQAAK
ncbi:MarR family winged helix-turn-helix transcriptional regulator [Hyphobacterium indicum]|uniref:MarR family winged helix-turn-helix transcriptional regulator n=1 Tax=Hyphobacterium indicum TaxID=2162714 RepID=UPI001374ABFB|nr:MarR family transcriptional regulator [Hyphobacterium indicum]